MPKFACTVLYTDIAVPCSPYESAHPMLNVISSSLSYIVANNKSGMSGAELQSLKTSQVASIQNSIGQLRNVTTEEATLCIESLNNTSVLDDSSKNAIAASIRKAVNDGTVAMQRGVYRNEQQVCMHSYNYWPDHVWATIKGDSPESHKMSTVIEANNAFGLTNMSETSQLVCVVTIAMANGIELSPHDAYKKLKLFKSIILTVRKLKKGKAVQPQTAKLFPEDPEDFMQTFPDVFDDEAKMPVEPQVDTARVDFLVSQNPKRRTSKLLQPEHMSMHQLVPGGQQPFSPTNNPLVMMQMWQHMQGMNGMPAFNNSLQCLQDFVQHGNSRHRRASPSERDPIPDMHYPGTSRLPRMPQGVLGDEPDSHEQSPTATVRSDGDDSQDKSAAHAGGPGSLRLTDAAQAVDDLLSASLVPSSTGTTAASKGGKCGKDGKPPKAAAAKAKAKTTCKATAKGKANAKTKAAAATASDKAKKDAEMKRKAKGLGCSKCRYLANGCAKCN